METIKGKYSDYMDDELPTPKEDIRKFIKVIAVFIVAVIALTIGIIYIISAPK